MVLFHFQMRRHMIINQYEYEWNFQTLALVREHFQFNILGDISIFIQILIDLTFSEQLRNTMEAKLILWYFIIYHMPL